ncbi:MAG: nucleotidyl transferase AbiEii/AbiGii toxin family protein [Clostridiales bacterium]|nr:nucleotidyl transferase AbiEii/AbiGii toxin family protein [Clostridiales bacterium]
MSKADSIKARLRNLAVENKKPFDYVLTHYFIERFLYRLSVSPYAGHFVLKGGLLLQAIFHQQARATRDIDLLAKQLSNRTEALLHILRAICSIPSDDGIVFDTDALALTQITPEADYQGVRVAFDALLDRTRGRIHIDIGFGDAIIPHANSMAYPTMLTADEIIIKAYSMESVIAEKFQAMVDLAFANSRMKDFYDIAMLATQCSFDGITLQTAIAQTFSRRSSAIQDTPAVFTEAFMQDRDKQAQWLAFARRINAGDAQFPDTITLIKNFLEPLYNASKRKLPWAQRWDHHTQSWHDR